MTRYAVGDLQGCLDPLLRLLDKVRFTPGEDELWSVGDIVNRGPQSLECLRFISGLGASAKVVLGNHDLHLLGVAHGIRSLKRGDTLQPILDAPDSADLLEWVRQQPIFHWAQEKDYAMVHAGLAPSWTLADAEGFASEVASAMRGPNLKAFLEGMYGDEPKRWSDDLKGIERLRVITNYFTRLRFCTADGVMDLKTKEGPEAAKPGYMPWYEVPGRKTRDERVLFGHWATLLGRTNSKFAIGLDTGCVWGNKLTLFNLETRTSQRCNCQNPAA